MVGVRGFEPPTPASRTQCSTRLSHTPTVGAGLAASPRSEDAAYSHEIPTPQAPISPFFRTTKIVLKEGVASQNGLAYLTASAAETWRKRRTCWGMV